MNTPTPEPLITEEIRARDYKRKLRSMAIDAEKTKGGGWTKKQLAKWGIPWPPPSGWREDLINSKVCLWVD